MKTICLAVICLLLCLFVIYRRYAWKKLCTLCVMNTPERILYPVYYRIGSWLCRQKNAVLIRQVYPLDNPEVVYTNKCIRLGRYIYFACFSISLVGILCDMYIKPEIHIQEHTYICREPDDGVSQRITAIVSGEDMEDCEISVEVRDQFAEGARKTALFAQARDYVLQQLAGDNPSLEAVRAPLRLVTEVPGSSMKVSWDLDESLNIMSDGMIDNQRIDEAGETQLIFFTLTYGQECQKYPVEIRMYPPSKTEQEKFTEALTKLLEEGNADSENGARFCLPDEVLDKKVQWSEKIPDYSMEIILCAGMLFVVFGVYHSGQERRELQNRKQQLEEDYPVFIHKLVLMSNAGMNMQTALATMVNEQMEHPHRKMHYVYQEIAVALKLMNQGVAEIKAYESFGKSCDSTLYLKLSSMMVQCVKKGVSGMNELMSEMAEEALMMRKDMVRQKAEKTSTKLLLPMGMILIVVFAILILPAFLSMNV